MNVGEGFEWTLEFSGSAISGISAMQVVSPNRSRFLGRSPTIIRVFPTRASFLGSSLLSVTSSWPILPSIKLPEKNRSEYCIFSVAMSQTSTVKHVSPAVQSGDNQVRLCACVGVWRHQVPKACPRASCCITAASMLKPAAPSFRL
jgi:hypothetical protein